ncbi:hypothetical protein Selin_2106 [Desulfurispirillum indicum S5]|uniref:Carboxypeptidase regulatory-like domain-containing protein n=1 Tax=Desulfurispirillum indicum (strain ATCC BAA-1389 / DSM 22839 / S5) TaxID=653733 RepID=E6W301_DESIS|nr:carboxypeptidase-like regulatory domain-containing protein [Desulfurispirillum indicum]ADU66826.1 hypothetical protein Selin_2106 [Desulfurispirillum indicum S5]
MKNTHSLPMIRFALVGLATIFFLLSAGCGGGGGGSTPDTTAQDQQITEENTAQLGGVVAKAPVNTIALKDASNQSLGPGLTIKLSPLVAGSAAVSAAQSGEINATTDDDGNIILPDGLEPGEYTLTIELDGSDPVTMTIEVGEDNFNSAIEAATPLIKGEDENYTKVDAIIATISGSVTNTEDKAIIGAQVALSGGAATNGVFVSALTISNGQYSLLINANTNLEEALKSATLIVSAPGYTTQELDFEVNSGTAKTGVNFKLATATSTAIFRETFETTSTTAGQWLVQVCDPDSHFDENSDFEFDYPDCTGLTDTQCDALWDELFPEEEYDYDHHYDSTCNLVAATDQQPRWNLRSATPAITNQAFTNELVKLAPNDSSEGKVPVPAQGSRAYWYGDPDTGNFLGEPASTQGSFDGGTSMESNGGALTSPSITMPANATEVSLTFQTWWEIESVNPNESGFDLMTIQLSRDNGTTWESIARLNPFSDPETGTIDRSPLPFSNTGFNSAPTWLWQEHIPLNDVANKTIKVRFYFDTNDGLFNGFRGWLIDDVRIVRQKGTAPLLGESITPSAIRSTPSRSR